MDGQLRLWSTSPLEGAAGKLLVWGLENYDSPSATVHGMQFFEAYDSQGVLGQRRLVEFRFRIIAKGEFEAMAEAAGFQIEALYGDYSYSPFDDSTSPFMIWKLRGI